jgi:uridine kinase
LDPVIIGIAGGTGAGKTTVIRQISRHIGKENIVVLEHDSYYRDLKHLSPKERDNQNFDHPSALETDLMIQHIEALKAGREVEVPVYDFTRHVRKEETRKIKPKKLILVDGILIFSEQELREHMDIKIFVDTDDDVRLIRRIRRDIVERDRSLEGVLNQYEKYVRPMHLEFVEPSKRYADIIIPRGGENEVALEMVQALIAERISDT